MTANAKVTLSEKQAEKRRAVDVVERWIDTLPPFRRDPRLASALRAALGEWRAANPSTVVFEFAGRTCLVDGQPIRARGKGLALAWFVLFGHQHRLDPLRAEGVFPGGRAPASAIQALQRAAEAAGRYSPALASAILGIGTQDGYLVVKTPSKGVLCRSPALARAFRRDFDVN